MTKSSTPMQKRTPSVKGAVGYGKPPLETRWAKGKSGNPNGRPKKGNALWDGPSESAFENALHRILSEEVEITHHGEKKKLPKIDVIVRSLEKQVFKGGPFATKILLGYIQEIEQRKSEAYQEEIGFKENMRTHRENYLAVCRKQNKPVEGFWPQDGDIIVEHGKKMRVRGALTKEDVALYEDIKSYRNLLIMENVYNCVVNDGSPALITADLLVIAAIGRHLSTQQLLESDAFWDMLSEKSYDLGWLKIERHRLWMARANGQPESPIRFPKVPKKTLRKLGLSRQQMAISSSHHQR